jgi:uncharacterized protein YcnI
MRHPIWIFALPLCIIATVAQAHVALQETTAPAGSYYVATFRVGHACAAGGATTALSVEMPAGVQDPKPQPKAGWRFERSGRIVTWRGRLEDDQFDVFSILIRLPATAGPLYFPTVQTCGEAEQRWVEIPAPGAAWASVPHPAPVVTVSGGAAPPPGAPAAEHQH